ncbi:MAG: hypothetical protein JSS72_10475 [Armatimonadetes bacterium]|nr:hypothetical protein [Armatimonadota bacterium]
MGSVLEPITEPVATAPTQREIFRFYYPLALSWLFMGLEGPICGTVLSRRPDSTLHLASLLVMMQIAMWIESPIMDLLSTSNTLSDSRANYLQIGRFTKGLMIWVTFFHGLLAFTPLFDFVLLRLFHADPSVVEAIRPGFRLMLFWSACIGWRRFLQGILIRNGVTRAVGQGTTVRVCSLAGTAFLLHLTTSLPGATLAGCALSVSVFNEAAFIHWASRKVVKENFSAPKPSDGPPISFRRLLVFHLPLALTTMVTLSQGPILVHGINGTVGAVLTLAGWQAAHAFIWLARASGYALPETVITLQRCPNAVPELWKFCITVGMATSGLLFLLGLFGIDHLLFTGIIQVKPDVEPYAHMAFLSAALLPLIGSIQGFFRGMLTAAHKTGSRTVAIFVAASLLIIFTSFGFGVYPSAVVVASIILNIAMLGELAVLWAAWKKVEAQRAELVTSS